MQRRDFLNIVGAQAALASAAPLIGGVNAAEPRQGFDPDAVGGHVAKPPRAYVFTDHRLIQPGDVSWASPAGAALPLTDPPQPVVDAHVVPPIPPPHPPPLFVHKSDTDTTVVHDEWLGAYVMYTRLYSVQRRMVAVCEAGDFRQWGPVRPLIWPGLEEPLSTDVYTNARTHHPWRA
jgi:hypothetical protein